MYGYSRQMADVCVNSYFYEWNEEKNRIQKTKKLNRNQTNKVDKKIY